MAIGMAAGQPAIQTAARPRMSASAGWGEGAKMTASGTISDCRKAVAEAAIDIDSPPGMFGYGSSHAHPDRVAPGDSPEPGMNCNRGVVFTATALGAGLAAAYVRVLRPWALRWGATDQEVARPLPGDEVVSKADFVATRAITIGAAPEQVWPWLVQMGSGRAGWYSYDRVDNAGVPSATEIIPGLQQLTPGDLVPMVVGKKVGVWVKELEPNRRMLWWDRNGEYSWEWLLEPAGNQTRLISRLRATTHPWTRRMLYEAVAANGDIIMTRKMMRGIKNRAERLAAGHTALAGGSTGT